MSNSVELAGKVAKMEGQVNDMHHDLYGNGQPGLVVEIRDFMSQQKGMWKAVLAIGIILTILVSVFTIRDLMRKADVTVPAFPQNTTVKPAENADIPAVRDSKKE